MKQAIRYTLASLWLVVVWAAGAAHAQSVALIKVNIPFDYSFGDKIFPPGNYSLVRPQPHFLVLRDASGQTIALAFTSGVESSTASSTSKVMFRSVDGQNVLSEVWHQDASLGERLPSANTRASKAKYRTSGVGQTVEGNQPQPTIARKR
jgi:hypothetical protein